MIAKRLVIVDIKRKLNKIDINLLTILNESYVILSLTPYASYSLDSINGNYITFHDLISTEEFNKKNIKIYHDLINNLINYKDYFYLLIQIMIIITYQTYMNAINMYIKLLKDRGYEVIYITDEQNKYLNIDKEYLIQTTAYKFYKFNNILHKYNTLLHTQNIYKKIINKIFRKTISYDSIHYTSLFKKCEVKKSVSNNISLFLNDLKLVLKKYNKNDMFFEVFFTNTLKDYTVAFKSLNSKNFINKSFTYLNNHIDSIKTRVLKLNNSEVIFFQHGSYLYGGEHSQWCETYPSTINFVFNDFTKKLFERRGATKVYAIGSVNFNYKISEVHQKYDYLYITYCQNYALNGSFSSLSERGSFDGNDSYIRHKNIVELFGTKFKSKKICIKIQPGIFLGTMKYIPLLELSKKYSNISIEFSIPVQKLISKSKYIISDYFSSEFINRELHYKRDVILFKGTPLPLPEKTLEDMEKMFILVNSVDELEEKVKNIEYITKNRKRYDDIIEYYSSKKCDTKKVVTEILEKELKESG